MYNVLLYKYQNSYQIRSYQFGIRENQKRPEESDFDHVEDEIDESMAQVDDKYHLDGHSAYVSVNRSKNKIFYYSRSNDWSNGWFCTLTIPPGTAVSDHRYLHMCTHIYYSCIGILCLYGTCLSPDHTISTMNGPWQLRSDSFRSLAFQNIK